MDDSKTVTEPTHQELDKIVYNSEFPPLLDVEPIASKQAIDSVTEKTQELSEAMTEQTGEKKNGILLSEPLSLHDRNLKIMELEALQKAGVSNEEDDKLLNELLKELEAEIAQVEDTGVVTTSPAPSSEGVTPSDDYDQFSESESQVTQPINERAKSGGETQSEGEGKSEEESEEHAEEIYVSVCY